MTEGHEPLLEALDHVLEALRIAQRALRASELRTVGYIARLQAGDRLADVVREAPVSLARIDINEALDRLTAARQASREAAFRHLVEDGMTRKEIASTWGFSQQMVSRVVNHEAPPASRTGT